MHVIYELARTFLFDKKEQIATNLFEIVRDLNPDISEEPNALLLNEYNWYSNGMKFDCFLRGKRKSEARHEIFKLANDVFDDDAKNFITERDADFKKEHVLTGKENLRFFSDNPPNEKLKTFGDIAEYYKPLVPTIIHQILNELAIVSHDEAQDIAQKIGRFPCLEATVMANLYMVFIAIVPKVVPSEDKVNDHRHIIEASYCDAFISEDRQLLANVPRINGHLEPIKWSKIGKGIVNVISEHHFSS